MRFQMRLVETEDQNRFFRAEALGGAGNIHCGVAAADNSDDAAKHRRSALLDLLQKRDRVDHLAAIHCRYVEVVRELRADAKEYGLEAALLFFSKNVGDPVVPRDLLGESLARQAIGGHAVSHHSSRLLAAIANLDLMPQPAQVVGA